MRNRILVENALVILLTLLAASGGSDDSIVFDRFSGAGTSAGDVACFLDSLQNALETTDYDALADLVSFPLRFNLPEGRTTVNSRPEFMILRDALFPPEVRALILTQTIDSLFVNCRGVMLGCGQVWFRPMDVNGEQCLRIITVNRVPH